MTLPVGANMLYFLSRGASAVGNITIASANFSPVPQETISIQASYERPSVFKEAKLCLLKRGDFEHGVGVFVSTHIFIYPRMELTERCSDAEAMALVGPSQ
jgi:hypothetical protein